VSIGLGFAGLGWLGECLLKELPAFPELRLAGVQDARPELAAAIAARYASPWHGSEFEALLAAPGVEAVVICTPNALHVSQSQSALLAGKHVLVQKPLALGCADAQATLDLARQSQRLLFVDYTYRFLDTVTLLRETQQPARMRAAFHNIYGPGAEKTWFFDPRLSGGGALVDLGVHLLDLALWLVQPESVRLVDAVLSFGQGLPVEDAAHVEVLLDDIRFDLDVSWNAPLAATEIAFETDRLRWENVAGSFFHFRTRRGDQVLLDRETTLRADTLRAFARALDSGQAPAIDVRVYALLDEVFRRP
jgi:predicted dehydrogenase